MKSKFYVAAFAALVIGCSSSSASATTYYMDLTLGTGSAVGSITTDGTVGSLGSVNIVSYQLTLTNGIFSAVLDTLDGTFFNGGSFTATPAGLFFNFSSATGDYFVFGSNPGLGFEDALGSLSSHPSTVSLNLNAVGDPNSPFWTAFTGNVEVAVATPLPAALPLFAGGLGVIGLLGWRRKWKARAIA
jgi:hypothetical protein